MLRCLVAAGSLASATGCLKGDSDLSGRVLNDRPGAYDDDSGLAPIAGGLDANASDPLVAQPGSFGPVLNGNVIDFGVASAFSAPLDASNGATVVYAIGQELSCTEWLALGKANASSLVQLQLPRSVPTGTYEIVLPDASSAALAPPDGQAYLSLVANGAPLLSGATGSLIVTASSAGTLRLERLSVTFAGGQTMVIDGIDVAPCVPPVVPGGFSVAAAYVRPASAATATLAALPPILTLLDRPVTCAALRSASTALPLDGNVLYLTVPSATVGTYSLVNTNAGTNEVSGSNGSLRASQAGAAPIANSGAASFSSVTGGYRGTVQAAFNDGSSLPATSFFASECP